MFNRRTKSLFIQSPRGTVATVQSPRSELQVLTSPRAAHKHVTRVPTCSLPKTTASTQATLRETVSPRSLAKGLKLLYDLFPYQKRDGQLTIPHETQADSKVAQSLLTPVRISYMQERRKTKCGESANVLSQLKRLFGRVEEAVVPVAEKGLSDIEKLSLEAKVRRRRLEYRKAAQSVPCLSPAATDVCTSPPPASNEAIKLTSKRPAVQLRPHLVPSNQIEMIVVNLPMLPFSQHKTYNDEANFTRNHLHKLTSDSLPTSKSSKTQRFSSKPLSKLDI